MAIRSKPEKPQPIDTQEAQAFIKKASVNQSHSEKQSGAEKKKALMLKLSQSEIEAIDAAVALLASQQTFERNKLKRHAFMIKAIFEKVEQVNTPE
jgi:hypothetical protein